MIQRKQTLFLLELVFLGIALLFVPIGMVVMPAATMNIYLLPLPESLVSTNWHFLLMGINVLCLLLAILSIFLYKKRSLQLRLCYGMLALWLCLSLMIAVCPLIQMRSDIVEINHNYFGVVIGLFAALAAFLAARFIHKDIELLKSADRIR